MKKILTAVVSCLLCCFIPLHANGVFFTPRGELTDDCKALFRALNIPPRICSAQTWRSHWNDDVLQFLKDNCWMDGEYLQSVQGRQVDFDRALYLLNKMGVIQCRSPFRNHYDFIVVLNENAVEAKLNHAYCVYTFLGYTPDYMLLSKPILVCENFKRLLIMQDSRLAFQSAPNTTLNEFVNALWAPEASRSELKIKFVCIPYYQEVLNGETVGRKTTMLDVLREMIQEQDESKKIYGNILIITSAKNLSEKSSAIGDIIMQSKVLHRCNVRSYDVAGYELFNGMQEVSYCQNVEPFSAGMFDKLTLMMCLEYEKMFAKYPQCKFNP